MGIAKFFKLSQEVQDAQRRGRALVALESTVITHGLPRPENVELAQKLEEVVRAEGAAPATIGLIEGRVLVGMEAEELETLAAREDALKLGGRDIATAIVNERSGGTTVAGTLRLAAQVGIEVLATGGIGGVHRDSRWDVSADLDELARQALIVVCAGAKAILDLPATLERLETLGVPVVGYQTNDFPAFYSRQSGFRLNARVDGPEEAAALAQKHWQLNGGGILLTAPVPEESALPLTQVEEWLGSALEEAATGKVSGQALSPYLLKRMNELSEGKSLAANLALLKNNARLAAQVALAMTPKARTSGLIPKKA